VLGTIENPADFKADKNKSLVTSCAWRNSYSRASTVLNSSGISAAVPKKDSLIIMRRKGNQDNPKPPINAPFLLKTGDCIKDSQKTLFNEDKFNGETLQFP